MTETSTTAGPAEPRKGLLRAAWRHRQFRYLLSAYAVSGAGDFLYTVALVAYVYDRTHSAGWVSAAAVVRVVPYVIFGPLGGTVAAKFDRQRVMIASDLIRAAVMTVMAISAALDGPAALMIGLAFLNTTATTAWAPAATAATPSVVGEDDLAAANAVEVTVNQLAWFIGPALGAILFAVTSATTAFVVNGATFVVSAVLVLPVTAARSRGGAAKGDEGQAPAAKTSVWRVVRAAKGVMMLNGLVAVVLLAYGFECVLYPLVADRRLDIGPEGAGYLIGAVGVGGLLMAPWSGRIASSQRSGTALAAAAVMLGAPLVLLTVVRSPVLAVAIVLLEGVGNVLFEVVSITFLQRLVKGDDLARVFGLQAAMSSAAMILGSLAAPVIVSTVGLRGALAVGGLLLVVYGVLAAGRLTGLGARLDAQARPLEPILEVFGHLRIFDGASPATLERLAGSVVEVRPAPGEVVIREGDEPDHFFIVREGTLEVSSADRGALAPLGPGQWFGEIGLLRGMPRTATVTASTPALLWRIDGATFGEAIAGLGGPAAVLEDELVARLALTMPLGRRA